MSAAPRVSTKTPRSQRRMGDDNLQNEKGALFLASYREAWVYPVPEPAGCGAQGCSLHLKTQFSRLENERNNSVFLIACCKD